MKNGSSFVPVSLGRRDLIFSLLRILEKGRANFNVCLFTSIYVMLSSVANQIVISPIGCWRYMRNAKQCCQSVMSINIGMNEK